MSTGFSEKLISAGLHGEPVVSYTPPTLSHDYAFDEYFYDRSSIMPHLARGSGRGCKKGVVAKCSFVIRPPFSFEEGLEFSLYATVITEKHD